MIDPFPVSLLVYFILGLYVCTSVGIMIHIIIYEMIPIKFKKWWHIFPGILFLILTVVFWLPIYLADECYNKQ
jgi:hypothetical protein